MQRHSLCRLCPSGIETAFHIEELAIHQFLQLCRLLLIGCGILPQEFGKAGHQHIVQVVVGRRGIFHIGLRLPKDPIADSHRHTALLILQGPFES